MRINLSYTNITNNSLPILIQKLPHLRHIGYRGCKLTDELSMAFRPLFASRSNLESFDFSDTPLTETFFTTLAATPVSSSRTIPSRLCFEARNCSNLTQPKKSAPFARDPKRPSVFLTNSLCFANCMDFTDKMTMHLLYSLTPTYSAVLTTLDLTGCGL